MSDEDILEMQEADILALQRECARLREALAAAEKRTSRLEGLLLAQKMCRCPAGEGCYSESGIEAERSAEPISPAERSTELRWPNLPEDDLPADEVHCPTCGHRCRIVGLPDFPGDTCPVTVSYEPIEE